MNGNKAPRINGLIVLFFQNQRNVIGDTLCKYVNQVFKHKEWDASLNRTLIALVLKIDNLDTISQFCPVSLCTVAYKLVTKVIVNKIKSYLLVLILET